MNASSEYCDNMFLRSVLSLPQKIGGLILLCNVYRHIKCHIQEVAQVEQVQGKPLNTTIIV